MVRTMRYEKEMTYTDQAQMIGQYPWRLLKDVGDILVLSGQHLDPLNVQQSSWAWGKRHGIRIATRREGPKVFCVRTA